MPHALRNQFMTRSFRPRSIEGRSARGLLALAFVAQLATGCSVGMALHGEKQPNLSVLEVGAERSRIEAELHAPESVVPLPEGRTQCTYLFEMGNESSAGRAAVHAGMDILTFGIWEIVGTPLEAMQGDKMQAVVTYDATGKAETIDLTKPEGGSAAPANVARKGSAHS